MSLITKTFLVVRDCEDRFAHAHRAKSPREAHNSNNISLSVSSPSYVPPPLGAFYKLSEGENWGQGEMKGLYSELTTGWLSG